MSRAVFATLLVSLCCASSSASAAVTPYNSTFAMEMLHFSGAAYCPRETVENWKCSFCSGVSNFTPHGVVYNQARDMLSYVGYKNDTDSILVSFRGTRPDSLRAWFENLDFFRVPAICTNCEVHGGFLKDYNSIRDETVQLVREITQIHPNARVVINGHSLGGALSYIASVDFALNHGIVADTIYTFGAPRVGNKIFVDTWARLFNNATSYRVTHGRDPMPHAPFDPLRLPVPLSSFNFYHPSAEVYYEPGPIVSDPQVCDGSGSQFGEDPQCAAQWRPPFRLADHLTYLGRDFLRDWATCQLQAFEPM